MADVSEVFKVLKASTGGGGLAMDQAVDATTAAAALNGAVGFAFKASDGNVILPQLTASGRIKVDTEGIGEMTALNGQGSLAAPTGSYQEIASVTLTADETYFKIIWTAASFREADVELVQLNDVTETVIAKGKLAAGCYNLFQNFDESLKVLAGSTGTQKLIVKGKKGPGSPPDSDIEATICCVEVPAA